MNYSNKKAHPIGKAQQIYWTLKILGLIHHESTRIDRQVDF